VSEVFFINLATMVFVYMPAMEHQHCAGNVFGAHVLQNVDIEGGLQLGRCCLQVVKTHALQASLARGTERNAPHKLFSILSDERCRKRTRRRRRRPRNPGCCYAVSDFRQGGALQLVEVVARAAG